MTQSRPNQRMQPDAAARPKISAIRIMEASVPGDGEVEVAI
jgi:hypothetical protein